MIDRKTSPLEIAERVLSPSSMLRIYEARLTIDAQTILDRWALNDPDALQQSEAQDIEGLIQSVQQQADMESGILRSKAAQRAREYGMCDMEIMQEMGPPVGHSSWDSLD